MNIDDIMSLPAFQNLMQDAEAGQPSSEDPSAEPAPTGDTPGSAPATDPAPAADPAP